MGMAAQADHPERELREVVGDRAVVGALRLRWRYAIGAYAGHRWVTMVREAVELADPAAESVLELLSRHAIWCSTLPRPQIGVRLRGDDGRYYWVDMWWPDRQVFGEADGLSKYVGPEALIEEKRRHEALEGPGRRGVRWGWEQVYPDPARMIDRIRHALATPPTRHANGRETTVAGWVSRPFTSSRRLSEVAAAASRRRRNRRRRNRPRRRSPSRRSCPNRSRRQGRRRAPPELDATGRGCRC